MYDVLLASHYAPKTPLAAETHGNGAMTLAVPFVRYKLPGTKSFHPLYTYPCRHDVHQHSRCPTPSSPPYSHPICRRYDALQGEHKICMGDYIPSDSEEQPRGWQASGRDAGRHPAVILTHDFPVSVSNCLGTTSYRADAAAEMQSRQFEQIRSAPCRHIGPAAAPAAGAADSCHIVQRDHVAHCRYRCLECIEARLHSMIL